MPLSKDEQLHLLVSHLRPSTVNLDKGTFSLYEEGKYSLNDCKRQICRHNDVDHEMIEDDVFKDWIISLGYRYTRRG